MRVSFTLTAALVGMLLIATLGVRSLPPPQIPMSAPNAIHDSLAADLVQGNSVQSVLFQIASGLKKDIPSNWQRLMHSPITDGTFGVETIPPADLRSTIASWGLADDMIDKAHHDIHTIIQRAAGSGVYVAQGFSYNWQRCQDVEHPACLSTLIVAVKVPYVVGGYVWRAEISHIYITTTTETLVQYTPSHTCHRCWFRTCCHDGQDPRNLDSQELQDVQAVMSTSQSDWALEHIPYQSNLQTGLSVSESPSDTLWPIGGFDTLLRIVVGNAAENRDVHRTHKRGLLKAFQNATLSHRQVSNSMQLTLNKRDIIPLLVDLLSSCFEEAKIDESVESWWNRVYDKNRDTPISVECEFARQRTEPILPPKTGCVTSTQITVDTTYSWLLVAPHDDGLEILFLEAEFGVTFEDCKCDRTQDQEHNCASLHIYYGDEESGSNVRWGYVESDGSFDSVEYLAEWKSYSSYVSKVLLDLLRFASASSYLRIPPSIDNQPLPPVRHEPHASVLLRQQVIDNEGDKEVEPLMMSLSFSAIMMSINQFAETWEKVAKAIGSSSKTDIKRRVCLGFDSLDYSATSSVMEGVDSKNMASLVEDIVDIEDLPKRDDIKRLMSGVKYSTNFTWIAESMTYTNPDGKQSYMFFAKYGNAVSGMVDVVYSMIKSNFVLAPDMLIVHRQKSSWGGFKRSDEMSIEYIPHTLTLNDTLILEMYWEMISFHQLAIAIGAEPPKYPDLSGLCDRSIP